MNLINEKSIRLVITDREGKRHDGGWDFRVSFVTSGNGVACYVDGAFPAGLSGENSIIIRPEIPSPKIDYLAIVNHSHFWCRPFFSDSLCELPQKTQELLAYDGAVWHCILPVCADTFKTVLRGCEGGFEIVTYSNCVGLTECRNQLAFVYETGDDPHALLRVCAEHAAELLGNGLKLREQRSISEVFEYLGWCSWDALQIRVSHDGLLEKAKEFEEKQVPVHFAIIDDMWGDVPNFKGLPEDIAFSDMISVQHKSPLRQFEGDPDRFPEGMKGAIAALKKAGIPKVGVWFPTTGYWGGFIRDTEEMEKLGQYLAPSYGTLWKSVPPFKDGIWIVDPTKEKSEGFFGELCGRVKDWGGDFVKIDNQGYHSYYKDVAPIGYTARNIQRAIDKATKETLDGALINCMGMPSECMFNRPDSAVSRCSDDFIPESREWFAKNILQCSYNGLLQGQYYVNDWDMWWTDDEQATKNSLCRAVSGGPIYVSDKIGRTRPEVLKPLVFSDGRIPRCDQSAVPTADCLLGDPTVSGKPFKIRNRVGENGVVAIFNIDSMHRAVKGTVSPKDAGFSEGNYVYYEFFTKTCGFLKAGDEIPICLDNNDVMAMYTFLPAKDVTPIGRTDLFVGVKAITDSTDRSLSLYEGGQIGFVSEGPIRVYDADGELLPAARRGCLTIVTIPAAKKELRFELIK